VSDVGSERNLTEVALWGLELHRSGELEDNGLMQVMMCAAIGYNEVYVDAQCKRT
jgi:hypothetical protein